MSAAQPPHFAVGIERELRQVRRGVAEAHVGHAVTLDQVREGERASAAVCGAMTTVENPAWRYEPRRRAAYLSCFTCEQHAARAR